MKSIVLESSFTIWRYSFGPKISEKTCHRLWRDTVLRAKLDIHYIPIKPWTTKAKVRIFSEPVVFHLLWLSIKNKGCGSVCPLTVVTFGHAAYDGGFEANNNSPRGSGNAATSVPSGMRALSPRSAHRALRAREETMEGETQDLAGSAWMFPCSCSILVHRYTHTYTCLCVTKSNTWYNMYTAYTLHLGLNTHWLFNCPCLVRLDRYPMGGGVWLLAGTGWWISAVTQVGFWFSFVWHAKKNLNSWTIMSFPFGCVHTKKGRPSRARSLADRKSETANQRPQIRVALYALRNTVFFSFSFSSCASSQVVCMAALHVFKMV